LERGAVGSLAGLDGRSKSARLVRQLEGQLIEHLGGNPTVPQKLLIERVCKMKLQLDALEEKLAEGHWSPHDQRTYSGLNNAFRLALTTLDKMKAPGRRRAPPLEEVLELHRRST
jgi:hypothetical protein